MDSEALLQYFFRAILCLNSAEGPLRAHQWSTICVITTAIHDSSSARTDVFLQKCLYMIVFIPFCETGASLNFTDGRISEIIFLHLDLLR